MELRPEFLLPAIAKSLRDTVMPAIDETHEVALEQLGLAIGFLDVLSGQLPILPAYDLDEYERHLDLARNLASLEGAAAVVEELAGLKKIIADSPDLRATGSTMLLPDATRTLRAATARFVDAAHGLRQASLSQGVRRIIVDHAAMQLQRERAMTANMGFEAGAEPIEPIGKQLKIN